MSAAIVGPPGKPVGFRTLQEITGYVATDDGQLIKVNLVVGKVSIGQNPDGSPNYHFGVTPVFTPITMEEYRAMVKGDLNKV